MRPIIAIIGTSRDGYTLANTHHFRKVLEAGGLPVLFSPEGDPEDVIEVADGILLVEGPDIHPRFYGEDPSLSLRDVDVAKDEFEITLVKLAIDGEIPILGVGRGMQIINVALGGTLYQDVYEIPKAIKHDWEIGRVRPDQKLHTVRVKTDSKLYNILKDVLVIEGTNDAWTWVNSFHHQAVKKVGEGLRQVAFSVDGLIEGIESTDESFVIGVQWQPEYLDEMKVLYEALVKAALGHQERKHEIELIQLEEEAKKRLAQETTEQDETHHTSETSDNLPDTTQT
ncbi:predicted glutamine amidotransferase, class I [Thermococcus kodakarensis KOD1]|uniref:Predicted glutamine amidotransferase, class I n=1 Tax=Thermococcus kodakarensis (strain ATCC BAA-918 / JCM 12380 / KOD1) TaxID=69014 RepID=Q5JFM7_THEKO|nr:gamma-glutamyl-gamma-aminobutyrate hydrolase family protein [Thermococcus kodakarensis]WCN29148.1 gamma-glutamyl-gamma-aminobutyrate hydrolase family protein [Thermococcus kodakarensis]WCN31454.1 gamma-glutamyl-gamma-aminobutyrate hydrolase family protein [Thermococcus kodakarensis]BAD84376.1 predicted glutamine amidotransferase, class I [Thermococcus kodakarensis KOD1]